MKNQRINKSYNDKSSQNHIQYIHNVAIHPELVGVFQCRPQGFTYQHDQTKRLFYLLSHTVQCWHHVSECLECFSQLEYESKGMHVCSMSPSECKQKQQNSTFIVLRDGLVSFWKHLSACENVTFSLSQLSLFKKCW